MTAFSTSRALDRALLAAFGPLDLTGPKVTPCKGISYLTDWVDNKIQYVAPGSRLSILLSLLRFRGWLSTRGYPLQHARVPEYRILPMGRTIPRSTNARTKVRDLLQESTLSYRNTEHSRADTVEFRLVARERVSSAAASFRYEI